MCTLFKVFLSPEYWGYLGALSARVCIAHWVQVQGPQRVKTILKKNRVGGLPLPDVKTLCGNGGSAELL